MKEEVEQVQIFYREDNIGKEGKEKEKQHT